ncbi:MAG: D-glycero-beta-D-manno-heptose 1,7-bisphosphate 7-phosphatase [Gammaproteobacteria bacterium]|nr:D-glycero-beta-D-manno-heptose 1,7-bisphosphate 7-phosphatase [Gammaproteobacteria bacterium]
MKHIILGRDGVINEITDDFIKSPDEWCAIPGSLDAIARLNRAGFQVIVITNQPGLAHNVLSIRSLNAIHDKMHKELALFSAQIESIMFCPHKTQDNCQCKKPKPGLFLDLKNRLNISLSNSHVVGDSLSDLQVAQEIGALPILVKTGKGKQTISKAIGLDNIPIFDDLATFTDHLLSQ